MLLGLAAVAMLQSRLLGTMAAAAVVVLVVVMLLAVLLTEAGRAAGAGALRLMDLCREAEQAGGASCCAMHHCRQTVFRFHSSSCC